VPLPAGDISAHRQPKQQQQQQPNYYFDAVAIIAAARKPIVTQMDPHLMAQKKITIVYADDAGAPEQGRRE